MSAAAGDARISVAGEADLVEWQAYVDRQPGARPLHHAGWHRVLRDSSSVEPTYLILRDRSGEIEGVLPAYLSRSRILGRHLTTLEGGALAASSGTVDALVAALRRIACGARARYVLVRGSGTPDPVPATTVHRFVETELITTDAGSYWDRLHRKTRWTVRQAEKRGFAALADERFDRLDAFYELYAAHVHGLGTPVVPREMFRAIARHLGPERAALFTVERGGVLAAGMLVVRTRDTWLDLYAAVAEEARDAQAGYLLYWSAIDSAVRSGARRFSLGRSTPGGGVHRFKRKWGGADRDLVYAYLPPEGAAGPVAAESFHDRPTILQRLWRRMPLNVANRIGPLFRRELPFG